MISLKKKENTVIEDYSVRPIKNEKGEVINDAELLRLAKDMLDECEANNVAPPIGLTQNHINFIYTACDELDKGMTIQQVKDKHIQKDVDLSKLTINPKL